MNDYLFYSLQSVPASVFMHQNVEKFAYESEQDIVVTGNNTVTQHC